MSNAPAKPYAPSVRRVVLGHDQDGKVAVQEDAPQDFMVKYAFQTL
jgi:hypothetical protein